MIVLGLSGGSGRIVRAGIQKDLLPGFAELRSRGGHGRIWSLTSSPPAEWTAHLTGVGPKKNGIPGYLSPNRIAPESGLARTEDLEVLTYPELLDQRGISVGLVNLPPTYPPLDLDHGFSISGMLTPVEETTYPFPSSLLDKIGEYQVGVHYEKATFRDSQRSVYDYIEAGTDLSVDELAEDVRSVEEARLDTALRLLEEKDPDLLVVLVSGLHALQRFTWHQLEQRSLEETDFFPIYREIDRALQHLMEKHPDRPLLVGSGHGFQSTSGEAEEGLFSSLRGVLGPWVPNSLRQSRFYRLLYDGARRTVRALAGTDDPDAQQLPVGLFPTGSPSQTGFWVMSSPRMPSQTNEDLRFLDLSALVMHQLGGTIPEAYEGSLPKGFRSNGTSTEREAIDLSIDRGGHPKGNENFREEILNEL